MDSTLFPRLSWKTCNRLVEIASKILVHGAKWANIPIFWSSYYIFIRWKTVFYFSTNFHFRNHYRNSLYSRGRYSCYSGRLHDFSVTIPRCYKDVSVNSFFPCTAKLWNSLPIACFPFTYDLNGFRSRINRHLSFVSFFLNRFPVSFFASFSCNSMTRGGCSVSHRMKPS